LGLELFRIRYVTLAAALTLILTIAPVYAAPNLKVGSTASYALASSLSATQSCTAAPIAYAYQVCVGVSPAIPYQVTILDQYNCKGLGINDPFLALECRYIPANLTVTQGSTVTWFNDGNVTHTVTANVTANVGLPSFASGPLSPRSVFPGSSFSYIFTQMGTYHYYDSGFTFMKGIVFVNPAPPPPPPPMPMSFQVELSGTVGWNVEGLSSSTANLLVTHNLGVSIPLPQLPIVTITPVTESGSLVQSIDLATRVESAGTATDLIEHVLDAFAASSSSQGFNSGFGNIISQMSATATSDPSYSLWWVNGPLSNGSPVQVMDGWASVTGSETLNLAYLGNVQAWIVTSQFSQGVNLTVPSSPFAGPGPNAHAAFNLNFLWSYDKGSDLLARSFANGTITMHSASSTQVPTNGYCLNYPCVYTTVQVTRDMRLTVTLALHLTSTSLSLDQRMRNGSSTIDMSSMLASMFATPWSALGFIGLVATAIIAFSLWLARRVRKSAMPEATPATAPGPTAPSPSVPTVGA
jgi:hypothetical protein